MDQLVRAKRAVLPAACFTNRFLSAGRRAAIVIRPLSDRTASARFPVTIRIRLPVLKKIVRRKNRHQHQIFAGSKAARSIFRKHHISIFPSHKMKSLRRFSAQRNLRFRQIAPSARNHSAPRRLNLQRHQEFPVVNRIAHRIPLHITKQRSLANDRATIRQCHNIRHLQRRPFRNFQRLSFVDRQILL